MRPERRSRCRGYGQAPRPAAGRAVRCRLSGGKLCHRQQQRDHLAGAPTVGPGTGLTCTHDSGAGLLCTDCLVASRFICLFIFNQVFRSRRAVLGSFSFSFLFFFVCCCLSCLMATISRMCINSLTPGCSGLMCSVFYYSPILLLKSSRFTVNLCLWGVAVSHYMNQISVCGCCSLEAYYFTYLCLITFSSLLTHDSRETA